MYSISIRYYLQRYSHNNEDGLLIKKRWIPCSRFPIICDCEPIMCLHLTYIYIHVILYLVIMHIDIGIYDQCRKCDNRSVTILYDNDNYFE